MDDIDSKSIRNKPFLKQQNMINDKNNNLTGVGSTPKYLSHQLGGYTSN